MFGIEGMEVAAYMIDMASSITIIGSSELPYQKTLGPEIGKVTMMVCYQGQYNHLSHTNIKYVLNDYLLTLLCLFFKMLEERGVTFYMNDAVAEVQGENRRVKYICSKNTFIYFVQKQHISTFFWKLID